MRFPHERLLADKLAARHRSGGDPKCDPVPASRGTNRPKRPVTQAQANKLAQLGWSFEEFRTWSSDYAGQVLRVECDRRKANRKPKNNKKVSQQKDKKMQTKNASNSTNYKTVYATDEMLAFLTSQSQGVRPATELQIETLARLWKHDVETVRNVVRKDNWSTEKASKYINYQINKTPSQAQMECLYRWGVSVSDVLSLDRATATKIIGWGKNRCLAHFAQNN